MIITLRQIYRQAITYVDFAMMNRSPFEFVLPLTADEVERAISAPVQRAGLSWRRVWFPPSFAKPESTCTTPLLQHASQNYLKDAKDER